jgi:hypothetical protein
MSAVLNGTCIIGDLSSRWRQFIAAKKLTGELAYRFEKLDQRLDSIAAKLYLKTVKAHQILSECTQLTEQFQSELPKSPNRALRLLTRLENHMDILVKNTHEFRIKAG